jgi:hypothetical protein
MIQVQPNRWHLVCETMSAIKSTTAEDPIHHNPNFSLNDLLPSLRASPPIFEFKTRNFDNGYNFFYIKELPMMD